MQAVYYEKFGDISVLQIGELKTPKLGPDSVLIRAQAASVNPVDWKLMAGYLDANLYSIFPVVPGWDVAGSVEAIGSAVTDFRIGDQVFGYVRMDMVHTGTFAEMVAAPMRTVAKAPKKLSPQQQAAIPLAGLTAYQGIVHALEVQEGETIFISGASGGVGTLAIQIARSRGANVIASSSPKNHELLESLGAIPVRYGDSLYDDLSTAAPRGIDALLDLHGGDDLDTSRKYLHRHERLVSIADGRVTNWGGRFLFTQPSSQDLTTLSTLVTHSQLQPILGTNYPLKNTADAFLESMGGHTAGKLTITIS